MRPIKFRGKSFKTGKLVYGDLIQSKGATGIIATDINDVIQDAKRHNIPKGLIGVEPETVAQLVGYDCDGNEVYEGDVIQTPEGKDYLIDDWGLTDRVFVSTGKLKKE